MSKLGIITLAIAAAMSVGATAAQAWDAPAPIMARPLAATAEVRTVALSRMAYRIRAGTPYAVVKYGFLCVPRDRLTWNGDEKIGGADAMHRSAFNEELKKAGFKTAGDPDSLFEEADSASPDFLIGAEVVGVNIDLCYQIVFQGVEPTEAKGQMQIDVVWQVYSTLDRKVVARISTSGGAKIKMSRDPADLLYQAAALENVKALINDEQFRTLVQGKPRSPDEPLKVEARDVLPIRTSTSSLAIADSVGSVATIVAGGGHGSGFIVGDGYLLTDRHVVGDAKDVRIRWSDGIERAGTVERVDARRDVALIKSDTRGRPPLAIRSDALIQGDSVFAIGTPLDPKFQSTVTRGVVSAFRTIDGLAFIQSDVTINPGNSGGPLLDDKGRVAGLTVMAMREGDAPTGINLFIPIRDAVDFLSLKLQASN